ncbi:PadR family transcriptional regulator [Streptomyces sp. NPDC060048]|uniref:PadR family transcriptional regulator n=1 Tax=unclassified Streptomyces TaxID=2593676 RepID=UPI0036CA483D
MRTVERGGAPPSGPSDRPSAGGADAVDRASEGGEKLFTLTEAGRAEAGSGPDAPWAEAGRGFDFEAMNEVRTAGFGLMEAFGQVFRTGTPAQREKALAVVNETRKKLCLILADEH